MLEASDEDCRGSTGRCNIGQVQVLECHTFCDTRADAHNTERATGDDVDLISCHRACTGSEDRYGLRTENGDGLGVSTSLDNNCRDVALLGRRDGSCDGGELG
jgi:hypothetical protein